MADKTQDALKWCAAALQALASKGSEADTIRMVTSGELKSLGEILDLANDAPRQEHSRRRWRELSSATHGQTSKGRSAQ